MATFGRLSSALASLMLLSASSCIDSQQFESCLRFNRYSHRQELSGNPHRIDDWWLLASGKIVMYDPSTDQGPSGMTGPLIPGLLNFASANGREYTSVTITYLSYHPEPTGIRLLSSGGAPVAEQVLDSVPQNKALTRTITTTAKFAQIEASNRSREAQIAAICVR